MPVHSIFKREYGGRQLQGLIGSDSGIALEDPRFAANPLMFAVFGYGGVEGSGKLIELLRDTTTVNLVCCLGAGCAARLPLDGGIEAVEAPDALAMFADYITRSVVQYETVMKYFNPSFAGYTGYRQIAPNRSDDTSE
ncbi:MAG: hypothetical protein ACJ8AT_07020 [Hyalangium sp.]|uniref:hypothetical protein n=1 Tax=Hyalangium sp. TaxID=2028555 RepID=UPI003899BB50